MPKVSLRDGSESQAFNFVLILHGPERDDVGELHVGDRRGLLQLLRHTDTACQIRAGLC